jgi:4-carboxymuconolactone decarboxylase
MTGGARVQLRSSADGDSKLAGIYARVQGVMPSVPAIYQALGNAPDILDAWIGLGWQLRAGAGADRGLYELAILRVAQLTSSEYVWRSHWREAIRAGVGEPKLRGLAAWPGSELFSDLERAVLALTDELTESASADDATWAPIAEALDDRRAVELVMTVAWYCCVARVAAGLAVPLDAQRASVPGLVVTEHG